MCRILGKVYKVRLPWYNKRTQAVAGMGSPLSVAIFDITDFSGAKKISERIRQAVEDYGFADGLRITISGGASKYDNETVNELINSAGTMLYAAKRNGKNQAVCDL